MGLSSYLARDDRLFPLLLGSSVIRGSDVGHSVGGQLSCPRLRNKNRPLESENIHKLMFQLSTLPGRSVVTRVLSCVLLIRTWMMWHFVISIYNLCLSHKMQIHHTQPLTSAGSWGACSHSPRSFWLPAHQDINTEAILRHIWMCVCRVCVCVCVSDTRGVTSNPETFPRLVHWSTLSVSEAGRLVWANARPLWFPAPSCFWISRPDAASLPLHRRLRQKVSLSCRAASDKGEFTSGLKAQHL